MRDYGRGAPNGMETDLNTSTLRTLKIGAAVAALGLMASACASHQFVRDNVQVVDDRVTANETRLVSVEGTAGQALQRANDAHLLAEGKFLYEVVLSDDSVKFPTDVSSLSPEAEQRLNELAQRLRAENANVYLEIQGYTDSTGSEAYNNELGLARAEAVRRYLNRQGVALNRMSTISYGPTEPVASNDTPEGRAQNRRVAIVVLA